MQVSPDSNELSRFWNWQWKEGHQRGQGDKKAKEQIFMLAGRGEKSDILSPALLHAVKIFIWVLPEGVVKIPRLEREISTGIRFTCFLSKSQYFMIIKDYLSIKGGKKEEGCYINKI